MPFLAKERKKNNTTRLLYPICDAPVPSSAQRKSLFPLDEKMSSVWDDYKEGKILLASDLWSHSQSGLSGLSQLPLSQ